MWAPVLGGSSCGLTAYCQSGAKMGTHCYSTVPGATQHTPLSAPAAAVTGDMHYGPPPATATAEPLPSDLPSEIELPATETPPPVRLRAAVPAPTTAELVDLVHRLGGASDRDPIASGSLLRLRAAPHQAARRLVGELRVLSPDWIDDGGQHVIWCVRALRVISGRDFRFDSATPLTADQRRVSRTCYGPLPFFSESASGLMTVAPADVQKRVIVAWQLWVLEQGDTFVPDERADPRD